MCGRRVAEVLPGECLHVRGQGAPGLEVVVDQARAKLRAGDPRRTAWPDRRVRGHDALQLGQGKYPLEVREKGVCIAYAAPARLTSKP